jgi:hypothetical protein
MWIREEIQEMSWRYCMKKTGFFLPKRLYLREELLFRIMSYQNERVAILVESRNGEPYATLTVNFPEQALDENEFCVKSWSENEELVQALYATNLCDMFENTRKLTDDMDSPIWRFTPEIAEYIKNKQEG